MPKRTCEVCLKDVMQDEPDPCLGYLPGIDFACCGHGIARECYLFVSTNPMPIGDLIEEYRQDYSLFHSKEARSVVRGNAARMKMIELGGTPGEFIQLEELAPFADEIWDEELLQERLIK